MSAHATHPSDPSRALARVPELAPTGTLGDLRRIALALAADLPLDKREHAWLEQGNAHAAGHVPERALGDAINVAQSTAATAQVRAARNVQDDPDDPAGLSATLYRLAVRERLRGTPPRGLKPRSGNTSSRFPMERGPRDLLFVQTARDGMHYVLDACGRSDALPLARKRAGKRP